MGAFFRNSPRAIAGTVAACPVFAVLGGLVSIARQCQSSQCEMADSSIHHSKSESSIQQYSPISPIRIFRPNADLEIAFDVRTKNPVYVLERLRCSLPDAVSGNNGAVVGKRPRHHFYENPLVPEMFRSRNACYHHSGYDRGHLAAAANYHTTETVLDTYTLCNVSPQDPRLNATVWARLEDWTRRVARSLDQKEHCDTFVVTGPLWLPNAVVIPPHHAEQSQPQQPTMLFEYQYPAIGRPPNLVAVPTHFFKLIVVVHRDHNHNHKHSRSHIHSSSGKSSKNGERIRAYACFVLPNRNVLAEAVADAKANHGGRLFEFEAGLVRWTDLEAATGLEFFTELADFEWKLKADDATCPIQLRHHHHHHAPPPLLLLPSMSSGTIGKADKKAHRQASSQTHHVTHLCPNGSCPKY